MPRIPQKTPVVTITKSLYIILTLPTQNVPGNVVTGIIRIKLDDR